MSTSTSVVQRLRTATPVDSENLSLLLVLPGLFFFSAFMFYPMVYLVYLSFTNARPSNLFAGEEVWVGLANYTQVLSDPQFWNSIGTTWLFVGTSVVLKLLLGVTIALVVTSDWVRGKRFMRSLIIVPMGLPAIFTITVWRGIFSPAEFGLANQLLGTFGLSSVAWFQERWLAFLSYNVTEMWLAYPFIVIITVSALQDVPEALHDAAKVDGAGFLARECPNAEVVVFDGFDEERLPELAGECSALLQDPEGLEHALKLLRASLPVRLRETAYAIACDIAAADGYATQEELRLLELLRHRLEIDRLIAAAIERGARARHMTL